MVVGAIVGVGIFFTPSEVARLTGGEGLALLAWAAGGLLALLGALSFAELAGMYPRSGGQYAILKDAYGAPAGFVFVFCLLTAVQAGAIAIIALVCADHLGMAVLGRELSVPGATALGVSLIVLLAAANILGVRVGAWIQNATVMAKVAALLAVSGLAVLAGPLEPAPEPRSVAAADSPGGALAVLAALTSVLFSYGGWQQATWVAGEVRRPRRNVPLAIVLGVILVVLIYMAVNWAYFRLLGPAGVGASEALAADAVSRAAGSLGGAGGGAAGRGVAAAVAVSAFGVLNAQFLTGPRLAYAMAADGRFFRTFARLDPRFGTPARAVLLVAAPALALILLSGRAGIEALVSGVVLVDWVFFGLTGLAVVVLRLRRPEEWRPVRVPLYPLTPLLFVAGALATVGGAFIKSGTRSAAWLALAWILASCAVYALFFRGRGGGAALNHREAGVDRERGAGGSPTETGHHQGDDP